VTGDELAEHMEATYPDPPPPESEERERWCIEGDRQAAWALRKLGRYLAEQKRLKDSAEEEAERIAAWLRDATHGLDGQVAFFQHHLEQYLLGLLDEDPQLPKTYKLPTGSIARRKGPDTVQAQGDFGDELFVAWALANDRLDLLRVAPDRAAIKTELANGGWSTPSLEVDAKGAAVPGEYGSTHAVVTGDGEVVPGIEYHVGVEKITAKPEEAQR